MADTIGIPTVVSELEGAGLMGAAAIALLIPFFKDRPGAVASTGTGFVWTKSGLSGAEGESVSLGKLGKLKIGGGAVTATLAANWYGPRPEIDVLFQLNDAQALALEVNPNVFQVADKVTLPGDDGDIIGYDKSTLSALEIALPAVALEFSFRPGLGEGIAASIQTYQSLDFASSEGVYEWTPEGDKLLVFRKFFDIAFGVEKLFVDLSGTNGVADFKSRFADVYNASWKGIGAQRLDIVIPVSNTFINASAEGFLVDFDAAFTGDFSIAWHRPAGETLKAIDAEVSLRENCPRRGEIGVTLDLNGVTKKADEPAKNASTASESSKETARADQAKQEFALRKADLDLNGQVRFSGGLTYGVIGEGSELERTVFGIELTGAAIDDGQSNAIETFENEGARAALWTLTALIGIPLFIRGAQNEDATEVATALGLAFLAIIVADETTGSGTTFLPRLKGVNLNKVKLRYIHIGVEETIGEGPDAEIARYSQHLIELGLDVGMVFEMKCRVSALVEKLISVALTSGGILADLFGSSVESAELEGNLELEFGNLFLRFLRTEEHRVGGATVDADVEIFPSIDEGLSRLLEERSPVITARQIPEIKIEQEPGSGVARPVVSVKAVRVGSGEDLRRGVGISFSGLGNASMAIATPSAGVVVFWSPDFSIEPMAQLQKDPGFSFLMPPTCYAYGVIDIGKPLPSIGGEQSRIAVDVGLYNTKVSAGKKLTADDQRKLRDFKNYEHAFGGEIVWGDATGGPNDDEFSFLFVEVHYEGKSPIFTIGPIGVYGLGGLVGHNIAPGIAKEQQNAVGIADWIFGNGKGSFDSVKNWPKDPPTPATWHPDRDWDDDKDKYAFGLFVKAGSAGDGGKSVTVDSILMLGFPEFWIALAGHAVIKPINATLAVVIVYDHPSRSFVIKAVFNYKIDKENGRIIDMKNNLEVGTTSDPKRRWFYLGHYGDDRGGPGAAELFKFLNIKFYVVYDTKDADEFGIVLIKNETIKPPAIPGPLFGFGALFQFGPKTYGPSWLNISLFAGLGFNIGVGSNPFIIYGDIYAIGHIQLKVAVFKGKLGFAARLYGIAADDFYRFAGDFEVRINLPWPLSDISETCSFTLEDGVPDFPPPQISTTATALGRVEPRSLELGPLQEERVPIDSVIALAFNKPIFEVRAVTDGNTMLTISDPQLPDDAPEPVEKLITEFADRKYEITLRHVLRFMRIERRPILDDGLDEPAGDSEQPVDEDGGLGGIDPPSDEGWILVDEVAAAWEPPGDYGDDGAPEAGSEPHHVIYLNTWLAPELQFSRSALERYYDWTLGWGTIPPCAVQDQVCLLSPGADDVWDGPDVDQSRAFWTLHFNSALGSVDVDELSYNEETYGGRPRNLNRLAWVGGELDLPEHTALRFPDADEVDLVIRIGAELLGDPPLLQQLDCVAAVQLRGLGVTSRLKLVARVEPSEPCGFALEVVEIEHDAQRLAFTADVERCDAGSRELVIRLNLVASEFISLIDQVALQGPFLKWDEEETDKTDPGSLIEIYDSVQNSLVFRLEQACFKRTMTAHGHWGESCLAGCDEHPEDGFGLDVLWGNLLLQPNSEYRLRYGVTSFATSTVQNLDENAPNETSEAPAAENESTEELETTMRSFRFRTEAAPSQDPARYVGLTYPASRDGSVPPYYPDHFSPFLSLKNSGLIRRIFRRHYGTEKLRAEIVDINGDLLTPDLVDTVEIGSGPLDDALEDIAEHCMPDAQHFTWLEMNVWRAQLDTGVDYSIQLADLREGATTPLWSRSFRTSGFRTFADHAAHVQALFADAYTLPPVDSAGVAQALNRLITAAIDGTAPGRDALVETIYRELLGIDGGSLRAYFNLTGVDFAGHVVGRDAGGELAWGMIFELDEPLFGKQGVSAPGLVTANAEEFAARGLYLVETTGRRRLMIADSAGTRVIILNSVDAVTFTPFQTPVAIELRYAPGDELADLARRYLEATAPPLDPAAFDAEFAELMAAIQSNPDLSVNLDIYSAVLNIALPALEVVPPPDTGGGGGTGGSDDGGGDGGGGDDGGGGPGPRPGDDPDPGPRPGDDPRDPKDPPTDEDPAPWPRPRPAPESLGAEGSGDDGTSTGGGKIDASTSTRPLGKQ